MTHLQLQTIMRKSTKSWTSYYSSSLGQLEDIFIFLQSQSVC